jgi:hypothetical protein
MQDYVLGGGCECKYALLVKWHFLIKPLIIPRAFVRQHKNHVLKKMSAVYLYDVSNKLYASPVTLKLLAAPGVDEKPVVTPCVARPFISIYLLLIVKWRCR